MKVKTKKILAVSLPITFGIVTLVASSAAIISCSSQSNDQTATSNEIPVTSNAITSLGTSIQNGALNKYTINQFNNFFVGSYKETSISQLSKQLGVNSDDIASVIASGDINDAIITINAQNNCKFVESDINTSKINKNVNGNISQDGKSIIYTGVTFAPSSITITNENISKFGQELDKCAPNKITKSEFENYFKGVDALQNFTNITKILGINDVSAISSIEVSGGPNNYSVSINASPNYIFSSQGPTVYTSSGSITNEGKSITYINVQFINDVNVLSSKINDFASILDQQAQNTTLESFNNLFSSSDKQININKIASQLDIPSESIENINATQNNSKSSCNIIISANNNYKFVEQNDQTLRNVNGNINSENNQIIFENVMFGTLPTITNFANNQNLSNQFVTVASSSEVSQPTTGTTSDVLLIGNKLTINVVSSNKSNPYLNVSLPNNNVGDIFDLTSLDITDASSIEWTIKSGTSNEFKIGNSNGKQFIYNTQAITDNAIKSIVLTATIKNSSGAKVANDVDVTFELGFKKIIRLQNVDVQLDNSSISNAFSASYEDGYGSSNYVNVECNVTTNVNAINIAIPYPPCDECNGARTPPVSMPHAHPLYAYKLTVNLNVLNEILKKCIVSLNENILRTDEIGTFLWRSPTNYSGKFTGYGQTSSDPFWNWNSMVGQSSLSNFVDTGSNGSFNWSVEIIGNEFVEIQNNTVNFSININCEDIPIDISPNTIINN